MSDLAVSRVVKRLHAKHGKGLSLKQFVRKMVADGNKVAKDWFDHKKGSLNLPRSDANLARANLERLATKAAKKSKTKK